ncbi:GlmU family protein [Flagellimonas zhangzhouensis]|uniref:UDP-N-acetylglucosamine diphosphorylase/glucosamine-1-phosphate N-acetyltransferase n=1 Tax=Flagellimonas zhangzhouensis TaxID=1073328 RepID=A0A1H2RPK4_9FLAO|nr:GlmU family protein [Allomuricauda zhangzhouensis]SDQ66367.1 UDP-N-acetylglucosamine diphosphorylase/glucosamine-1-phosphate N-acetyltransferase [Allomuricauda zhangzhouensis]SDW21386.1 UDP-N-acetylglucosamine diphosphorylase/glucosamine-1-phosphate N-acetyltransferase [Allomuricauda zhangzhouensis]
MNYILSDGYHREDLFPFTFTRPVAEIRTGILTISEKWEKWLDASVSFKTEEYLSEKFPMTVAAQNIVINGSYLPNKALVNAVQNLKLGEALMDGDEYIAYATTEPETAFDVPHFTTINFDYEVLTIKSTWDIFSKNAEALQADFDVLTEGKISQPISNTNQVAYPENIFIEEGATVEFCILNASTGPIYIGKNALMMEGCMVRGGLALCENAILKMGAKIYGAVTAGPGCKLGGEVNNAVLFANSNKGHDGFLGNSVLGEWCNIGADTNTSNLKNNYAEVRLWNYRTGGFAKTGLQFCGLMMGDHSKCGINVMFNTGTVVGVSANIFGSGFPRNFIPSYSWGGATAGYTTFKTNKAFEVATAMMKRRNVEFDEKEAKILQHVFEFTQKWRNF